MKLKISYILYLSVMFGMSSCISDDSSLDSIDIHQLKVAGAEDDAMPVFNFNMGDDCVITPEISYNGNMSDLTYEWGIGTYTNGVKGDLAIVSTESVLNHKFLEGGIYYAHLKVTDGKVGQVMEYQINVNRTFEHGYFLVSNDENGKSNMAFVKVMTPEEIAAGAEQVYIEHSIERMNEGVSVGKLIDCSLQTQEYEDWRLGKFTRLLTLTDDECLFLDPNTLTVLASLKYDEATSGFRASNFIKDSYSPYLYDANQGKYLHLNSEYMYLYEKADYVGNAFDDYFAYPYKSWGSVYYNASFADYEKDEAYGYDAYYYYYGLPSPFVGTGALLNGQDLLTVFMSAKEGYSYPSCLLSRSKEGQVAYLYKFSNGISDMSNYPPTTVSFAITSETALPEEGERIWLSETYSRHYYTLDNKIYVALVGNAMPFPNKDEYALSFPVGETITYMYLNFQTDELYVATYDEAAKRGNFYIYDIADVRTDNQDNATPKMFHKHCADKIVSILYKESV